MSEWQTVNIGSCVKTNLSSIGKKYELQEIQYLDTGSITCNRIDGYQQYKIEDAPSRAKRLVQHHDIIYSSVRPNQLHYGFITLPPKDLVVSTGFVVITCNQTKISPKFLYYNLTQNSSTDYLHSIAEASTSAYPSLKPSDIEALEIGLPPLPEQKAIASILSSLDDKIDLLHRQNKTLEAMAESLFRQWFVQEADDSWEEVSLFDSIQLIGGGTPKTKIAEYWDGDIGWLAGGDISSNHKTIITSSEKSITRLGLDNSSAKLLPQYATVISARGTVGKYCILSEPMAFSQSNYGILPKVGNCFFYTYLLINHSIEELQSAAYGSVFDTITTETFKGLTLLHPAEENIVEFEDFVRPLFAKIFNNRKEIENLQNQRDTLLPKLMSGEVKVGL